jgi:hypothetical protein
MNLPPCGKNSLEPTPQLGHQSNNKTSLSDLFIIINNFAAKRQKVLDIYAAARYLLSSGNAAKRQIHQQGANAPPPELPARRQT